jgi:tripeptidyl-peptidase-1
MMRLASLLVYGGLSCLFAEAAPSLTLYNHGVESASRRHGGVAKKRIPASHALHERHAPEHTDGWSIVERADPKASLPMRIGLKQSNLDKGHDLLMDM